MPSDYYRVYVHVPSLVLIAQAVFVLECRQTDGHTDTTRRLTHAGGYTTSVVNYTIHFAAIGLPRHTWSSQHLATFW